MTWLTLALASAFFFALAAILQRVLMKDDKSDPVAYAFVFQFLIALMFFAYAFSTKQFILPPLKPLVLNIIIMSVLWALFNLSFFKAMKEAEASEVTVIFASRSIWTAATAALFLNEMVDAKRIIGTLFILLGVAVVSLRGLNWKFSKGHIYALLAGLIFGVSFTNDAFLLKSFDAISYLPVAFLLPAITIVAFQPRSIKNLKIFLDKKILAKMIFAGFFWGAAALATYGAFKIGGDASQISPVTQLSIIFTVALSYLLLKERDNLPNKIVGALLVFAGISFLQ